VLIPFNLGIQIWNSILSFLLLLLRLSLLKSVHIFLILLFSYFFKVKARVLLIKTFNVPFSLFFLSLFIHNLLEAVNVRRLLFFSWIMEDRLLLELHLLFKGFWIRKTRFKVWIILLGLLRMHKGWLLLWLWVKLMLIWWIKAIIRLLISKRIRITRSVKILRHLRHKLKPRRRLISYLLSYSVVLFLRCINLIKRLTILLHCSILIFYLCALIKIVSSNYFLMSILWIYFNRRKVLYITLILSLIK